MVGSSQKIHPKTYLFQPKRIRPIRCVKATSHGSLSWTNLNRPFARSQRSDHHRHSNPKPSPTNPLSSPSLSPRPRLQNRSLPRSNRRRRPLSSSPPPLIPSIAAPLPPAPSPPAHPLLFPPAPHLLRPIPSCSNTRTRSNVAAPAPPTRDVPQPRSHGIAAGLLADVYMRALMRGALSSWPDRGACVACLGFVGAALHTGHESPATITSPTRVSEAVVYLALHAAVVVFVMAPHGSQVVVAPDLGGQAFSCQRHCFLFPLSLSVYLADRKSVV